MSLFRVAVFPRNNACLCLWLCKCTACEQSPVFKQLLGAQDYESLKEHLKGEAVKEFIKYTAKENVRCPSFIPYLHLITSLNCIASLQHTLCYHGLILV